MFVFDEISAAFLLLRSFPICLRNSFLIFFFHLCLSDGVCSYIPKYLCCSFSLSILILSWFGSSISSIICLFPFFLLLSILLSGFSWISWWILWHWKCTRSLTDSLLSSFIEPYHRAFLKSLYAMDTVFSASLCSPCICADQSTLYHMFLLSSVASFLFLENSPQHITE